ncbi:prominin-1-A-like isoform X2 [Antedon mediterranea]|uniref:prominin-1-A-like isoform X2 n=1 Tax=Antedon mediterranea TaxID=105859 RepID=UPI003AF60CD1
MIMRCLILLAITLLVFSEVSSTNTNNNGDITWASLPEGQEYSEEKFDGDRFPLDTTWNSIDGFLKFISPGDPPYEIISDAIGGEFVTTDYEPVDYYNEFKDNILGFTVLFAIGIIFIVVFPIVALCFCCCRCCNKCGGTMEQKSSSTCMCCYLIIGLIVSCAFILGGVGTAYSLNNYTADSVETFADDVNSNIDNIVRFVENTNDELSFLVGEQLNYALDQVKIDLNDIGNLVGVPVRDELDNEVGPAITSVKDLATSIDDTYDKLVVVNDTQNELADLYRLFKAKIDQVRASIGNDCSSCSCCSMSGFPDYANDYVSNVDYQDLGVDNGLFPQFAVDQSTNELQGLKDDDLASVAAEGEQTFIDIPETLTNSTQSDIDSISENIEGFQDDIQDAVDDLTSELDSVLDETDKWSSHIDDFGETAQDYDVYRVYMMAGIFGLILLVPIIWLLGLSCGLLGRSSDALPTERGCISNCGGCLLILGAALVFIFGTFLMILTTLPFIIGGPVDRLFCDPFQSGEVYKETVDKKGAIPGVDGYYLSDLLLNDSSIPLKISAILDACENNEAIYTASKLEYLVNISEYLNYKEFMPDIDSQFENITGDFSNIDILPDSGKQTLEEFGNSSVISINFTLFNEELGKDITMDSDDPNDLSVSAAAITDYIDDHGFTGSNESALITMAGYLTDLQSNFIDPMVAKRDALVTALDELQASTTQIEMNVNSTLTEIEAAQTYIDSNIDSLIDSEVSSYSDRVLGYAEQYVNYVNDQVQTEVGRCKPLYNVYEDSLNLICVSLLQSWNSLWFCIGWCLFFMLAGIVYSIKLAKYFRKMQFSEDTYDEIEMSNVNKNGPYGARLNANKVHPHNGYA